MVSLKCCEAGHVHGNQASLLLMGINDTNNIQERAQHLAVIKEHAAFIPYSLAAVGFVTPHSPLLPIPNNPILPLQVSFTGSLTSREDVPMQAKACCFPSRLCPSVLDLEQFPAQHPGRHRPQSWTVRLSRTRAQANMLCLIFFFLHWKMPDNYFFADLI